jgi:hypothetical protein
LGLILCAHKDMHNSILIKQQFVLFFGFISFFFLFWSWLVL